HLAVQAIDYLSTVSAEGSDCTALVDAAMADLLTRLEHREDPDEDDSTLSVLQKCVGLECFGGLPESVQAGYLHELGRRRLLVSEFDEASRIFETALQKASDVRILRGRCALGGALAALRVHRPADLAPVAKRPE